MQLDTRVQEASCPRGRRVTPGRSWIDAAIRSTGRPTPRPQGRRDLDRRATRPGMRFASKALLVRDDGVLGTGEATAGRLEDAVGEARGGGVLSVRCLISTLGR